MCMLIQQKSIQCLYYIPATIIGDGNREVNYTNMILNFGGETNIRVIHTVLQGVCDRGDISINTSVRQGT